MNHHPTYVLLSVWAITLWPFIIAATEGFHPASNAYFLTRVIKEGSLSAENGINKRSTTSDVRLFGSADPNDEGDPESSSKQQLLSETQKEIFERLSLSGADRIAAMEIPERAKRAMLAEAVEDRIFELTEILEKLVEPAGGDTLVAEDNRKKAVQIAKQTKALQQQYEELVTGQPSAMLQSLEGIMGRGSGSSGDREDS